MSGGINREAIVAVIAWAQSEGTGGGGINLTTGMLDHKVNPTDGVTQTLSVACLKPNREVGPSTIRLNKEDTL